jgi:transcriptional regulator of acetoin/glycerol metabolism
MTDLRSTWNEFVKTGTVPDSSAVPPFIIESWRRCRRSGLDPFLKKAGKVLSPEKLRVCEEQSARLLKFGSLHMNNLYEFVRNTSFMLCLADASGIILKIVGDDDIISRFRLGNYIVGSDWSEKQVGTNGIGTALYMKSPVQINSYEHYCRFAQVSTCSSAIIRDEQFNILGVITMTGPDDCVNKHTLGMVVAAANAIENSILMSDAQARIHIENDYLMAIMDSIAQGVIALDNAGRISHINDVARRYLKLDANQSYIGATLFALLPNGNDQLHDVVYNHKFFIDKEIDINTKQGNKKFILTTSGIDSQYTEIERGMILAFEEFRRAKRIVQKMSGAMASMTFDDLSGKSECFQKAIEVARKAALSESTILITGESGTGKDLIAQAIHNDSQRASGPYVVINCGAIPKELIGSELFGYSYGAFTGSRKGGNIGKFELADGGTLFLDEIAEMPFDMQVNLLRVLEDKQIMRIGSSEITPVNVRIIAATNKSIAKAVENGQFRHDLYYRLNVVHIDMPALRDRHSDIRLIAKIFYDRMMKDMDEEAQPIPEGFMEALERYNFPGNIRELRNIIERCINLSEDKSLRVEHLPEEIADAGRNISSGGGASLGSTGSNGRLSVDEFERTRIIELMVEYDGNISKVAGALNVARSTLYRKLVKYGIIKHFQISEKNE